MKNVAVLRSKLAQEPLGLPQSDAAPVEITRIATASDSTMAMASAAQELATAVAVSTSAPQFLPLHSVHKNFT